jgi:hypothetical protein
MRLTSLLVPLFLIGQLAHVAPAAAQGVEVLDHRHGRPPVPPPAAVINVSAYSPQAGPAGTVVTISGSGFIPATKVYVAGRRVRTVALGPTSLSFKIPACKGNGAIELRTPPNIRIPVGTFACQVAPRVTTFTPSQGGPGTQVTLNGQGFQAGDQIFLSGMQLAVVSAGPDQIVVSIPAGATSGFFTVTRPSANVTASAHQRFNVTLPAPTLASINPSAGPPGTRVRISGANLPADARVRYGRQGTRVLGSGPGWIDAQVPLNARRSEAFSITTRWGSASTSVFTLAVPAQITGFSPTQGGPGTIVTIRGNGLAATDQVAISGVLQPITARRGDRSLTIQIAPGTASGRVQVKRAGAVVGESSGTFDAIRYSKIINVAPTRGPVGTRFTIALENATPGHDTFMIGNHPLPIVATSANSYTVQIPPGATTGVISWSSYGRPNKSAFTFVVTGLLRITSISPTTVQSGEHFAINGQGFGPTPQVSWNGRQVQVVEVRDGKMIIVLSPHGTSGSDHVIVDDGGARVQSTQKLTVTPDVTIASVSPASGPVGTQVVVTGANFPRGSVLQLDQTNMMMVSVSPTRLVGRVPRGAPPVSNVWVRTPANQRYDSNVQFRVGAAPPPPPVPAPSTGIVLRESPDTGPVGTRVTITMEGGTFSGQAIKVWFGASLCPVVSTSPTRLVVTIPPGAKGTNYLVVDIDNVRRRPTTKFTVTAAGTVIVPTRRPGYH